MTEVLTQIYTFKIRKYLKTYQRHTIGDKHKNDLFFDLLLIYPKA